VKRAVVKINKYHGFSYEIIIFKSNNNSGYIGEATLFYPAKEDVIIPIRISGKDKSIFLTEEQAEKEINTSVMNYLDGREEEILEIKTPSGFRG
jgi:hypothetical protein